MNDSKTKMYPLTDSETQKEVENEKFLISIKDASKMYGIGQHRLRQIISDDYQYKYHLRIGRVIKIKRKSFEDYLNIVQEL